MATAAAAIVAVEAAQQFFLHFLFHFLPDFACPFQKLINFSSLWDFDVDRSSRMTKSRERAFENLMLLMLDNKKVRTESESDDMKSERGVHVSPSTLLASPVLLGVIWL